MNHDDVSEEIKTHCKELAQLVHDKYGSRWGWSELSWQLVEIIVRQIQGREGLNEP